MIGATAGVGMVTHAASSAAGGLASKMILNYFTGINPPYNKESRRRMRYIQQKYAQAYGAGVHGEDACSVIQQIDPTNRILMDLEGRKPANPFPDERSFEDSLQLNFHPVSGHQGRFVASHAMACLGVIIDYQNKRRKRPWVPGVITPGRPNDYVNLFLEETKTWLKTQLTLDSIHAEELERRDAFYTKLKNDNYYWCFPSESESCSIHKVVSFVHDKVKNALEVVSREEKNKSLQSLFKELNDHTTNAFEFGKTFLAYLIYPDKNAGTNIAANTKMDGKTVETGKLHRILEQSTEVVFKSYVDDMTDSINNQKSPEVKALEDRRAHTSVLSQEQVESLQRNNEYHYTIRVADYEEPLASLKGVVYLIEICDPKGHKWIVRKHFSDCESLHAILLSNVDEEDQESFPFPTKISKMFPKRDDYLQVCGQLASYFQAVFDGLSRFNKAIITAISAFVDVKYLIIPQNRSSKRAEDMPNLFLKMKKEFTEQLVAKKPTNAQDDSSKGEEEGDGQHKSMSKSMVAFKKTWGIEWVSKIFEAYSHLQRMATILSWTLEINHFFVSMFGNTLTFSKLPLRDILSTQKDIMNNFLVIANDIYKYACKLNCDQQYKWHKNLQMTENELIRLRFHIEKAIGIINGIESDHLDYEAQMRRLRDVNARFQPLMNRIDGNLLGIQNELGLQTSTLALTGANLRIAGPGAAGSGSGGYLAIENGLDEKPKGMPSSSAKYLTNGPSTGSPSMDKYEAIIMMSSNTNTNTAPGKGAANSNYKLESMPTSERVEELPSISSIDGNRRVPISPSQVAMSQEHNEETTASPTHPPPERKSVSGDNGSTSQVCTVS